MPKTVVAENRLDTESQVTQQAEIQKLEQLRLKQIEDERIRAYSIELTSKAEKLVGTKQGQCVLAARRLVFGNEFLGKDYIQGYVRYNPKNLIRDPQVGSFIIMMPYGWRHTGVVLFSTPTDVYYYDSNWDLKGTAKIQHRKLNDLTIKGYIPVNIN